MQAVTAPLAGTVVRTPAIGLRLASDARLARLAAAGSDGAMGAIFERHHQALHRYCYSIVGNGHDAADALQNTMVKALGSLPGETRRIALRPWLYRVAHNESISLLRARRPDSNLDAAANVRDATAAGAVDARERLRLLGEDLRRLTERQRSALLMRELGGLEFDEVAQALGTTEAAVKQSVYEARRALQAIEEGRAMDCESVRRTLSDGDRRVLRGMRMRSHLGACAGCRDFEVAMRGRPAQLAAMIPPLPAAAAATMLHGILGGGSGLGGGGALSASLAGAGTGAGTGGGGAFSASLAGASTGGGGGAFSASLAASAKAVSALSLGAKVAVAVTATATVAGGALYAVPAIERSAPQRSTPASATDARSTPTAAGALASGRTVGAGRQTAAGRSPARSAGPASVPAAGSSPAASTSAAANGRTTGPPPGTRARGQAGAPARGPATATTHGKPASTPGAAAARNGRPAKPAAATARTQTPSAKPATPAAARAPKPSATPAHTPPASQGGASGQAPAGTQPAAGAPGAAGSAGRPLAPGASAVVPPGQP